MSKNILVIDDEEMVTLSIKRLLRKSGYEVDTSNNGTDAMKKIKESDFDLIISDIRMPGEDGIEIVKKIRVYLLDNKKEKIPEILITGCASEDKYKSAVELQVRAYINKPFDITELLQTVKEILG